MKTTDDKKSDNLGVSESIGFLLIFSIMIAGIGLVMLYGYPLLLKQQVSADEKIMEKNMIVLQNDIKSLAYKTVPYKETSLKIGGGSLAVYNSSYSPSSSEITITDISGTPYITSFNPGELRYDSIDSQTDISLQNGAVAMRPRISSGPTHGSVMLSDPRWFYDQPTNQVVINLINITSDDIMAREGIGTVRAKLGETAYNNYIISDVVIEYLPDTEQDYSIAWDNYIIATFNQPGVTCIRTQGAPGMGALIKYQINPVTAPAKLVIKQYEVNIESI